MLAPYSFPFILRRYAMPITITEALAEIKTIGKRIEKKRGFVAQYVARQEIVHDPLTNQGGSEKALREERQAIADLEARIVGIRLAINAANVATAVTVGTQTKTIAEWLTWRRDVVPGRKAFLTQLNNALLNVRREAQQKGLNIVAQVGSQPDQKNIIVNLDERALAQEAEQLETTLGTLDGLLSLKNATVTIDV